MKKNISNAMSLWIDIWFESHAALINFIIMISICFFGIYYYYFNNFEENEMNL